MSALGSDSFEDAEDFYRVVKPKSSDKGEPFLGACYSQRSDICWIPNRAFEQWTVVDFDDDTVTLQPARGRWVRGTRRVQRSIFKEEYKRCSAQRQRPPC